MPSPLEGVIVIPHAEHLHAKSRKALESFMAAGGTVYTGGNSTLGLPGLKKLPGQVKSRRKTPCTSLLPSWSEVKYVQKRVPSAMWAKST